MPARAVWTVEAPNPHVATASDTPLFLAPPLKHRLATAAFRAGSHPLATLRAIASGARLGEVARFALWRDTAAALGVVEVITLSGRRSPLTSLLPRPSPPAAVAPRIGGLVIAQDEESCLPNALKSLTPFCDEIVVVDGGSRDATVDIARHHGCRVVRRSFDRDFGAQRNAGLVELTTDWVLSIDADEVLSADLGAMLVDLTRHAHLDAVAVPRWNLITGQGERPQWWPDFQVKLYRSRFRYRGAVHERLVGLRRTAMTPLSGPYLIHSKSQLRQHRASLLYQEIDPSELRPDQVAWVRAEIRRLEQSSPDQ